MSVQGITATVMATDLMHALCSDGWRNPGDGSKFGEHVSALLGEWAAQSITPPAAAPAPVVPGVRTVDPAGVVESADEAYVSGWNDCREAMLANAYATNSQEPVAEVTGNIENHGRVTNELFWHHKDPLPVGTNLYTAIPSQPAAPQGTNWHAHHVIVCQAALQMVRNALRNDAERGLVVRGEMLEELDKVTYPVASASPAPLLVRDVAEMLGTDVSHVCKAFIDLGLPPQRSTNMEVTPDEAVAVAKHLAATPSQEPVTLTDDQRVELDYLLERALQAVDLLHYIRCHPKRHDLEREWLNKADTVIGYWDAQNTKMRTNAMIAALREKERG